MLVSVSSVAFSFSSGSFFVGGREALSFRHTLAVFVWSSVRCSELVPISVYLFIFVNTFYTGLHVETKRKEVVCYLSVVLWLTLFIPENKLNAGKRI